MKYPVTVRQAQKMLSRASRRNYTTPADIQQMSREICWAEEVEIPLGTLTHIHSTQRWLGSILARLAIKYGPNHIILASPESPSSESKEPESRPKGTDEVRPQSDNPSEDSPFHGGDGASGEVKNGPDQNSQNQGGGSMGNPGGSNSTPAPARELSNAQSEGVPTPKADVTDDAGQVPDQSAPETDEVTSGEVDTNQPQDEANGLRADGTPDRDSQAGKSALPASSPDEGEDGDPQGKPLAKKASDGSDTSADALTGRANQAANMFQSSVEAVPEGAQAGEMSVAENWEEGALMPKETGDDAEESSEIGQYRYRKGTGRTSKRAKHSHGGVTAEMRRVGITSTLIKRARKAMARLVEGGETQTGPRYDWKEFTARLKSYRPVAPARKEEEGRPAILILADVSGSCSGFADKSLMVAQAVAKAGVGGADIIIVAHSNGNPVEWSVNGKRSQPVDVAWDESLQWYDDVLRRFNLEVVIALGDWDAEWLYHHLAELSSVKRFIWLDNWSCSTLEVTVRGDLFKRASRNEEVAWHTPWYFQQLWSPRAKAKSVYVVGCSEAEDFLKGLELGIRRKRKNAQ